MKEDSSHRELAVVAFLAGVLALNYPLLSLFDHRVMVLGVPLLYLYLFGAWLLAIVLIARVMARARPDDEGEP